MKWCDGVMVWCFDGFLVFFSLFLSRRNLGVISEYLLLALVAGSVWTNE